jgi:N-acetylglucosamine-6-phosphate deacetylase
MEKLIVKSVFDGLNYEISILEGIIQSILETGKTDDPQLFFGPGFLDIQVNGYGGVDYNLAQKNYLDLGQISRSLLKVGVCNHFPTVITNSPEQINKLLGQILQLVHSDNLANQCISGIHLEGPFISSEDGPRGAHFREYVQAPDWELFRNWQERAEGNIKLLTLSPEWENATKFIEKCVDSGVKVSIGHTNASPIQIQEAVKAGAILSTHLGNGTHAVLPRHPNYIWSQLAEEKLATSIIADGFHLPKEVIQVFKKVKGDKLILISDAVALAGMEPGNYDTPVGGQVTLTSEGKLHLRENSQTLAGSAMNILQGVNFMIQHHITNFSEAWAMASIRPHKLVQNAQFTWDPVQKNDLIIAKLNEKSEIKIQRTFKNWKEVYTTNH